MKKTLSIFVVLFLMLGAVAQEDVPLPRSLRTHERADVQHVDKRSEKELALIVGGNFGFQLIGTALDVQLSPHIGVLPLVDWLCIGVGGTYQLTYIKNFSQHSYHHVFGGNVFVEAYAWDRLIFHAEYELLSFPKDVVFATTPFFVSDDRPAAHGVLAGIGYKQDFGKSFSFYGLFLVSLYDPQTVRGVADIRIGVNYKFVPRSKGKNGKH